MSAADFASRYVTTTRGQTLRRARASCSRPRPRDGTAGDSHVDARADFLSLAAHITKSMRSGTKSVYGRTDHHEAA